MRLVKLPNYKGESVYVDPEQVVCVYPSENSKNHAVVKLRTTSVTCLAKVDDVVRLLTGEEEDGEQA